MALSKEQRDAGPGMMDRYAEMYSTRNMEGLLALCAPGICGYGSCPDEVVDGAAAMKAQEKRDFSQAGSIAAGFRIRRVDGEMPVAWVMADCNFDVVVHKTHLCMTGRMTAMLQNTGSRWLFSMVHFSIPTPGRAMDESFPGIG